MNIEYFGKDAIVTAEQTAFTFQVSENPRDFYSFRTTEETLDWGDKDYHIAGWRIYPYGDDNNLPKEIQRVVQNSSDAPGMLKRKFQLLWGKGPKLYKERIEERELIKEWQDDKDVQQWLNSWDYEEYLMRCAIDYINIEGAFSKVYPYKGSRVDKNHAISKLEHVSMDKARLASSFSNENRKATHAAITDFSFETLNSLMDLKVYPLFDVKNPFKHKTSIYYANLYSFCSDYYTVPDIYGALEWLRRSNAIPLILKAISKNSINASYQVISPQIYWDGIETKLKKNCEERNVTYTDSMLKNYELDILKGISKVLSSEENAGKFWHTKKILEIDGTNLIEHGWEIKLIPNNLKDFVKAQETISNHSSQKISTSIGLHSAIGGSGADTKVNSGGEQHYAVQNYLLTQNDVPDAIVTKMINLALKINFPEKDLKIGFYHIGSKKLQEVTPSDRPLNQEPS